MTNNKFLIIYSHKGLKRDNVSIIDLYILIHKNNITNTHIVAYMCHLLNGLKQ